MYVCVCVCVCVCEREGERLSKFSSGIKSDEGNGKTFAPATRLSPKMEERRPGSRVEL